MGCGLAKVSGIAAYGLYLLCPGMARVICGMVPHSYAMLSVVSLYGWAQALGLLWMFLVSLLSAVCTHIIGLIVGEAGDGSVGMEGPWPLPKQLLRIFSVCYVYYCVVHVFLLFGQAMWTAMWEMFHDYPTMRRMLLGGRPRSTAADSWPDPYYRDQSDDPFQSGLRKATVEVYVHRRLIVLMTPLLVQLCLGISLLVWSAFSEEHAYTCQFPVPRPSQCGRFFGSLSDPVSRLNRNARFVLFVCLLQWTAVFIGLFPSWHTALVGSNGWWPRALVFGLICVLMPASCLRLAHWFMKPAGTGVLYHVAGMRHYLLDSMLVPSWCMWWICVSAEILRQEVLDLSGFSLRRVANAEEWKPLCATFKCTVYVWLLLHFLRGCFSFGVALAQNDAISITVLYPTLFCLTWTAAFVAVTMQRFARLGPLRLLSRIVAGLGAIAVTAWLICSCAGCGGRLILIVFVWIHLCRQSFLAMRWYGPSLKYAVDPKAHNEMSKTYFSERRMGRVAIHVLAFFSLCFCIVLVICVFMTIVQQKAGLFLDNPVWWRPLPDGIEFNNHEASVLTLRRSNATMALDDSVRDGYSAVLSPQEEPHYAICGQTWYGLSLVDYALLSFVTYLNPSKNDIPALLGNLFPHIHITLREVRAGLARKWLEFELETCSRTPAILNAPQCRTVTVVGISGTDVTHVADYTENLRMWTEPVTLMMLSTLFPTIRVWPRDTSAMVIGSIHRVLSSLGVQDDSWHYREVLEHVRAMPRSGDVVVTGHSLGGGLALVVGALSGRLAVALQPPGVYHSLAKHQAQQNSSDGGQQALHKKSVSLVFEGDWIQHFDSHGGLVQTMMCDRSEESVQLACHMLEGAICHILRHCGDQSQRFASCHHEYMPLATAVDVLQSMLRSAWELSR